MKVLTLKLVIILTIMFSITEAKSRSNENYKQKEKVEKNKKNYVEQVYKSKKSAQKNNSVTYNKSKKQGYTTVKVVKKISSNKKQKINNHHTKIVVSKKPTYKKRKVVYKKPHQKKVIVHNAKPKVKVVYKTPTYRHHKEKVIVHKNRRYKHKNGIFFKLVAGMFELCAPPVGIRVTVLPPKHRKVFIRGKRYYHHNDTYYHYDRGEYVVVDNPNRVVVERNPKYKEYSSNVLVDDYPIQTFDNLPHRTRIVEFDGRVYYKVDNSYYKAVSKGDNVVYEFVMAE